MKTNKKSKSVDSRVDTTTQLAGGFGAFAAKQDPESLLRRCVMANLLWEDLFYEDGVSVADNIKSLISSSRCSQSISNCDRSPYETKITSCAFIYCP